MGFGPGGTHLTLIFHLTLIRFRAWGVPISRNPLLTTKKMRVSKNYIFQLHYASFERAHEGPIDVGLLLLNILAVWCQKWQLTPQALKCDCVVFENTGFTRPTLNFAGEILPVKLSVVYLGYLLNHRGSWQADVERRLEKAVKWDNVAVSMLGKTGRAPVGVVATVGETTAETGILYGAEFT